MTRPNGIIVAVDIRRTLRDATASIGHFFSGHDASSFVRPFGVSRSAVDGSSPRTRGPEPFAASGLVGEWSMRVS